MSAENCASCSKTVYSIERLAINGQIFHKPCFKCNYCKRQLNLKNLAALNGVFYCIPHFEQLYLIRGNCDEAFGNEPHRSKWINKK